MKFKFTLFIVLISFFLSCSSDDDKPTETLLLSEFEKSLIPFQEETSLQFLSDTDVEYTAVASAANIEMYFNPGDEVNWNLEGTDNSYVFGENNLVFRTSIFRLPYDRTAFDILVELDGSEPDILYVAPCDENIANSEGLSSFLVDIEIQGMTFENVFIFRDCRNTGNSSVNKVIYSIERGIEYVEFDDGSYLFQN